MVACPVCGAPLPRAQIATPDRCHGTPGRFEIAICRHCAAGVSLPVVGPAELSAFYPSSYAPHTDPPWGRLLALVSKAIRWWLRFLAWRAQPLSTLSERPPGRGLDVGAGRGETSAMLAARGWRMTAVEPSPAAAATLRERGIDTLEGVVADVELQPGAYDFALFQHALEHVLDPVGDLRAVHAALKPGGLVLVTLPNFGCWERRVFGGRWFYLEMPRHRVHFAGRTLERVLRTAGFDDVELHRSSSAIGIPASLQYLFAGRCLFPDGMALRVATGLCVLTLPVTLLADRLFGGGEILHAVARRPGGEPRLE
jgi:SAM-dependent methyltransferase